MVDTSYSLHENYERQEHPYDLQIPAVVSIVG